MLIGQTCAKVYIDWIIIMHNKKHMLCKLMQIQIMLAESDLILSFACCTLIVIG